MEISQDEEVTKQEEGVEDDEITNILPEEIVLKILSMIPFPQIFKLRTLSKSWRARLSPTSSQDNNSELHRPATSFQSQVSQHSTNWKSFCPVLIHKERVIGYDKTSQIWQTLPDLSFIPRSFRHDGWKTEMEGTLLLVSHWERTVEENEPLVYLPFGGRIFGRRQTYPGRMTRVFCVANLLTRSWKQLPPPPRTSLSWYFGEKLVSQTSDSYKVVMLRGGPPQSGETHNFLFQIYDSKLDVWRNRKFPLAEVLPIKNYEYFNGVLYMVVGFELGYILSFDVEKETFRKINLEISGRIWGDGPVSMVVCSGNLVLVQRFPTPKFDNVIVLKVDLASRRLLEVTRAHDDGKEGVFKSNAVGDGDYIFFTKEFKGNRVLVYNMRDDEWTYIPFLETPNDFGYDSNRTESSYRPGLNPFVAI